MNEDRVRSYLDRLTHTLKIQVTVSTGTLHTAFVDDAIGAVAITISRMAEYLTIQTSAVATFISRINE
jgi:hypothetical protein